MTLELLYEAPGLPSFDLPEALAALYGGTLGFDEPRVYANFVSTVDGVVAIPSLPMSNKLIAGGSESDRFVMGLLRACADVVVVGSGTLLASPKGLWTAAQASPGAADGFAELRRRLGHGPEPEVAVISATGLVDTHHPVFERGAVVLTNTVGAGRLEGELPRESIVDLGGDGQLGAARMVDALRGHGHRLILHEGGPHAIAPFLAERLVDELFLTVSPLLAGRPLGDPRYALVEGADLVTDPPDPTALLGIRRDGDHLFLRYDLTRDVESET